MLSEEKKPLLATREYANLDGGFKDPQKWFEEWDRQVKAGNSAMLIGLLYWGLKFPELGGPRMICHYLEVANGHSSEANFGEEGYNRAFGILCDPKRFGSTDIRIIRKLISEKAWTELCNKFFEVEDFYSGPVHKKALLYEEVVEKLSWFFRGPDSFGSCCSNLPRYHSSDSNYVRRARTFLHSFLIFAWNAGNSCGLSASAIYGDSPNSAEKQRCSMMAKYYFSIRPRLIEVMAGHGMLDLLHRRPLDLASRRKLKELALTPPYSNDPKPQTLVQAFVNDWGRNNAFGTSPKSKYPEAAQILLLYPHLLRGLRKSRQQDRASQQAYEAEQAAREKAAAQEKLRKAKEELERLED